MQSNPFSYRQFRLWLRLDLLLLWLLLLFLLTVASRSYCCRCDFVLCFSSCSFNRFKSHRLLFQLPFLFQFAFSRIFPNFSFFVRIYSTTLFYCSISFVSFTVFYFIFLVIFVFFNAWICSFHFDWIHFRFAHSIERTPTSTSTEAVLGSSVFEYSESAPCSLFCPVLEEREKELRWVSFPLERTEKRYRNKYVGNVNCIHVGVEVFRYLYELYV